MLCDLAASLCSAWDCLRWGLWAKDEWRLVAGRHSLHHGQRFNALRRQQLNASAQGTEEPNLSICGENSWEAERWLQDDDTWAAGAMCWASARHWTSLSGEMAAKTHVKLEFQNVNWEDMVESRERERKDWYIRFLWCVLFSLNSYLCDPFKCHCSAVIFERERNVSVIRYSGTFLFHLSHQPIETNRKATEEKVFFFGVWSPERKREDEEKILWKKCEMFWVFRRPRKKEKHKKKRKSSDGWHR